jgi:hypothetical protein
MNFARLILRFAVWTAIVSAAFSLPSSAVQNPDSGSATGRTYHLDCQASGTVDSDQAQFQLHSIGEANAILFRAGDRLLLKRGTTCQGALRPQGSGKENAPIVIGTYGEGALPRIEARSIDEAVLQLFNQEYWEVSSLELSGGSTYGLSIGGDAGILHHFHLRDLRIHDVRGTLKRKESGLLIINSNGKKATFDGVEVDGIRAWNTTQWAGILVFSAKNVRIRNSAVHDVQGDGIVVFESSDAVIARSIAWHTGMQHVLTIGTPNSIWTWRCTDCVVEENEAFLSDSPGVDGGAFDIDFGNIRNTVRRNFGHDTVGYCVSVFGAFGPTIASVVAGNLCIHNGMSPRLAQRQGAILLMTWQGGTLDGVDVRGNRVEWQAGGDASAIQSGSEIHASGIVVRENEIESTGLSFVDPALKYKGEKNRYLVVNGGPAELDEARRRLARLNETDSAISTIKRASENKQAAKSAEGESGPWQLIVTASPTVSNLDALRGTIIQLESAALQYGHAGLDAVLVGNRDLRSLISDYSLKECGLIFHEEPSESTEGISVKLVSPNGKVVRQWQGYPGPVELGIELRKWLGEPNYSHLSFEDVPATG